MNYHYSNLNMLHKYFYYSLKYFDIPYHLKPLVYDIHRNYLNTKDPTTWQDIKDYIHSMPSKKLVFSMNYL